MRSSQGLKPDAQRVTQEIQRLAERNVRIGAPERVREMLAKLAPRPFALARAAMTPLPIEIVHTIHTHPDEQGISFKVSDYTIILCAESAELATWRVNPQNHEFGEMVYVSVHEGLTGVADLPLPQEAYNNSGVLHALGSIWLETRVNALGLDPEAFRPFDVDAIEDSAKTLDLGYDL